MGKLARARHLFRLDLRRVHQARVGVQRRAPITGPFDICQFDNFSGDS